MAAGAVPDRAPGGGDDDFDVAADLARFIAEVDAGRIPIPPEEDAHGPAVMFTLGETADVDPMVLAAMAGPDGLGGQAFAQDAIADALRPGPLLAALTENAAGNVRALSDDELLGMVSAARRLQNRGEYLELAGIAEFTARRQAQLEAAIARKDPRGRRDGEFADAELGMELLITGAAAADRMDLARELATRLPLTFTGLAAGTIDGDKAYYVWFYTRFLSDADAAEADAILAAAAPGLRPDQLARKAAGLEIRLDPEAARQRKEHARTQGRRVEARREPSGNMSYGGRELAVEEALAVNSAVEADAAALRRAGMPGSLRELRVICFLDRLRGRNPLERVTGTASTPATPGASGPGAPADGDPGTAGDPGSAAITPADRGSARADSPAPFPALINLFVPAGTLFGWSTAPGEAGRFGLLDPDDTRRIVYAAAQHPRTRWCVTVTGPDGTAAAHGCSRGPHPWTLAPPGTASPGTASPGTASPGTASPGAASPGTGPPARPDEHQRAQLARLLRALSVTLTPVAKGTCDHGHREQRYEPSRKLKHLVRARTATCPAPGCGARAWYADIDHTIPWPAGPTCQHNLSPPCRRHHRAKQARGWKLEQIRPGVMRWTTPSGRTYVTTATVYEL